MDKETKKANPPSPVLCSTNGRTLFNNVRQDFLNKYNPRLLKVSKEIDIHESFKADLDTLIQLAVAEEKIKWSKKQLSEFAKVIIGHKKEIQLIFLFFFSLIFIYYFLSF